MNRTQKFALNSLTSMISQIVVMAAGMITPRLMIATYGSEMNGLVSSLNQFISYLTLVEAGIGERLSTRYTSLLRRKTMIE
mgnify:CR=1 FL=1